MIYTFFGPDGRVRRTMTCEDPFMVGINRQEGEEVIMGDWSAPEHYRWRGETYPLPAAPAPDWVFDPAQAAWIDPLPAPDRLALDRKTMRARAADRRYLAMVAGIEIGTTRIATDDTAQSRLTGAALTASLDPAYELTWKGMDGAFVTLSAAEIMAVAAAVRAHVQACFDREAALVAEISTSLDPLSVDIDTGWPS